MMLFIIFFFWQLVHSGVLLLYLHNLNIHLSRIVVISLISLQTVLDRTFPSLINFPSLFRLQIVYFSKIGFHTTRVSTFMDIFGINYIQIALQYGDSIIDVTLFASATLN